MLANYQRVHFVGIGGSGMSGLAELLQKMGCVVTGSDQQESEATERLRSLGVRVYQGHAAEHVADADIVVVSSAVRAVNPEVREAQTRQIPIIPRAELLADLMRQRSGIAIAGAHGKTTTTSMIALVLEHAGLDPTAVIGGRLADFGSNARLGRGKWMVAEADESDRSFLRLTPTIAVITNLDDEHLEAYDGFEDLQQAFVDFANNVDSGGAVVLCSDDPHLSALRPRVRRRVVTYGFTDAADFAGRDIVLDGLRSSCTVHVGRETSPTPVASRLELSVPGRHNLQNALATVAVGAQLGIPAADVAAALARFHGADRRFQVLGRERGVTVIDDYGHHPTEIRAVLAAAREQHPRHLIIVFQPHRYTRTRQLMNSFGNVLVDADAVLLTDIYGAGEDPIAGVTIDALAQAVRAAGQQNVEVLRSLSDIPGHVSARAEPGDVVVLLGAGSIGSWGPKVLAALREQT